MSRSDDGHAGPSGPGPQVPAAVIDWLLDTDPSIRWQTMRDLLDSPESTWLAERTRVETEGWGARLLTHQDADGQWDGGAFVPGDFTEHEWQRTGQPWTATAFSLSQLHEFGFDPGSDRARRTVELIGANARWDHAGEPFWEGEVEECINGRLVADGAYFGVDMAPVVARLVGERLDDGGWNCERANGSLRSSFDSTINVLEGLLEYERVTGGTPDSRAARETGEEYLLQRHLFRRLGNGEVADERFLSLLHPNRWLYDVLRALDYFRSSGVLSGVDPDPRLREPIDYLRSRILDDGTWSLDRRLPGRVWFDVNDGEGLPSPWLTLRAWRVLRWWES